MSDVAPTAGTAALDDNTSGPLLKGRAAVIRHQYYSDADGRREAEALASAGLDTTLLCLRRPGEPRWERLEGVDIRRFRSPKQRGGLAQYVVDYGCWFALCFTWLSLQQLRRPFRVVQVTTLPDFQIFAAAVTKLRGTTIVLFLKEPAAELVESTGGPPFLAKAMRVVSRAAIKSADVVFTVTEQHRQMYVDGGSDPNRLVAIENTPPRDYLGVHREDRRAAQSCSVLCHGTVEERYGHATIVEAALVLRERGEDVRITVTGSGTWAATLEELISQHGLADMIDYRGFVSQDELDELLATATIGVVAQLASAYSNVVHTQKMFEFFSLGIPVVASRLDATQAYFPDAIEFFDSGDGISLADAIQRLAEDPKRCAHLVSNADQAYRDYEWPKLRRIYLHTIAEAVNGR